jgi:hypothetical protein
MDFIEGLPKSGNANCVLVIIEKCSKYGHFIPLLLSFSAASVAKVFLQHVYKLHGMPSVIILDRDRIFTSHFWQELFKLANVSLYMSSSYHPQTDGQIEWLNQCLQTFLCCFVQACPKKWLQWIPLAEFWYNTSHHSGINCSPFEVLCGHKPKHFDIQATDSYQVPELDSWLKERELMSQVIKQHPLRAQMRMKVQADKHPSEVSYEVGDKVFLKLQPYIQSSLAQRARHKLAFKYFGPYAITEKIGSVAYRLDHPAYSSIHPVFSCLTIEEDGKF